MHEHARFQGNICQWEASKGKLASASMCPTIFRLVSSSSQTWAFDFYWRAMLKYALLSKTWLVYNPMSRMWNPYVHNFRRIITFFL